MASAPPYSFSRPASVRTAVYLFGFGVLPAFFWWGGFDVWNLPRWCLAAVFLSGAFLTSVFTPSYRPVFPRRLWIFLGLAGGWTLLSLWQVQNMGDASYLLGIRSIGLGWVLWLSMQNDLERVVAPLVALGLVELGIGAGEWLGWVEMTPVLQVPIGTSGNNNIYGCLLALLLPFTAMEALRTQGWARWSLVALAGALLGMIALSTSKSAILGLGLAAAVLALWHWLRRHTTWLDRRGARWGLGLGIPLAVVAAPLLWAAVNFDAAALPSENSNGINERGLIWRKSLAIIAEEPWLGSGPAGWKYKMMEAGTTGYNEIYGLRLFTRPHNDFLWLAADSGLPAAFAYLAFLLALWGLALERAGRASEAAERTTWYLLAAGVMVWLVVSSLNFPLERVDHLIVFAPYVAWIMRGRGGERRRMGRWGKGLLGGCLALAFGGMAVMAGLRWEQDLRYQEMMGVMQVGKSEAVIAASAPLGNDLFTVDYYSSTPLSYYRGMTYLQMNQPRAALAHLQAAYALNPWHPHVLNNLGSTYVSLGDLDAAERFYREARERFRDFPDPYINLSRILVAKGKREEAIGVLNSYPTELPFHRRAILNELELLGE